MTDNFFPPDRLDNIFDRFVVPSAVQAIAHYVEGLTGNLFDQPLRDKIAAVLVDLCKDYSTWLDVSATSSMPKATDSQLRAAARSCNLIADSMGHDVTNEHGVPITQEVNRALLSLTEAVAKTHERMAASRK